LAPASFLRIVSCGEGVPTPIRAREPNPTKRPGPGRCSATEKISGGESLCSPVQLAGPEFALGPGCVLLALTPSRAALRFFFLQPESARTANRAAWSGRSYPVRPAVDGGAGRLRVALRLFFFPSNCNCSSRSLILNCIAGLGSDRSISPGSAPFRFFLLTNELEIDGALAIVRLRFCRA